MKEFLLVIAWLSVLGTPGAAQTCVRKERVATVTRATFDSLLHARHVPRRLAPVRYDVDVYEVDYQTSWWNGERILASGLVLLPHAPTEALPLLAYNHGTRLQRERAWKMGGEETICALFAADGYAVCIPDYVGLGRGERAHLYHHALTEALCTVDLLRVLQELNQELGNAESGQLFLTGYSQGGHAAMATHRYLQSHPEAGFKVTASAPMSGAYDLAGVQGEVMLKPYAYPGYLPYLLFSFQAAYHILPDSAAYFKPPYDSLILPFFDGNHKLKELNSVMPHVPAEVLADHFMKGFRDDSLHPLRQALKENSLIHWTPEAPMLLCFCKADEQVSYRNALVARDTMEALGSTVVQVRHAARRLRHGPCAIYASMYARMWFDSFRQGSTSGEPGPAWNRLLIGLSKLLFNQRKTRPRR